LSITVSAKDINCWNKRNALHSMQSHAHTVYNKEYVHSTRTQIFGLNRLIKRFYQKNLLLPLRYRL